MELLVDARNALGECILWCERGQRLFWTDILGRTLWSHAPSSGENQVWAMPERLASFALTEDAQRLLLGLEHRLAWLDLDTGMSETIMHVGDGSDGLRLNDGRCDRQGRFVFGTMNEQAGRAPIGRFYRLDAALRLETLALQPVAIANSICFSLDGRTMYFCDSLTSQIRCCDYGDEVANERPFAMLPAGSGEPDGSVIDAQGYLWNAEWGAGKVVRYAPDGTVDRSIALPVSQPACLTFGGADLDELFVSTALVDLIVPEQLAGGVFVSRQCGATGTVESRFSGAPAR